jgi:hypothetical protein
VNLVFGEIEGTYTRKNIAGIMMEIIEKYRFANNLSYFMINNLSTNNILMQEFSTSKFLSNPRVYFANLV